MMPGGVFRFDNTSERWVEFLDPALANTWVNSAAVDGHGQVWLVVQSNKETRILARVADHLVERDKFDVGFTREEVIAYIFDRSSRQWIAWRAVSGVSKLGIWASKAPGQQWAKFTAHNAPLSNNHITSLTLDKRNRVWAGTTEGFTVFDGESVADWSMIIPGTRHGPLTMAQVPGPGLADQKTVFTVISDHATVDSRGRLWARSFNGVSVFDEEEPVEGY
jgi:ligand-binding sensor domain-containing protein